MTLYKQIKSIAISLWLGLCFISCRKNFPPAALASDYYITSSGAERPEKGSVYAYDYRLIIPPNALLEGQLLNETVKSPINKLALDSTFSSGIVSNYCMSFSSYNCSALSENGIINLALASQYKTNSSIFPFALYAKNAKPYCVENTKDINEINNWEAIPSFTIVTENYSDFYSFRFTDLKKTYFIGWTSN